jgi:hypothetical protein
MSTLLRRQKPTSWLLLLALISFVSGCGGSSGGGSSVTGGSTPPTGSPPELSRFTALITEGGAGLQATVSGQIEFSDPDGDLGGGSFSYAYDGSTFSFPIDSALDGVTAGVIEYSAQVQFSTNVGLVDVSGRLRDSAGNQSSAAFVSLPYNWRGQFGTTSEDSGNGVAVDNSNNVVVAGTTGGDLSGQINSGDADAFVSSFSTNADHRWTQLLGSNNADHGADVAVDSSDNIYVVGSTLGSLFGGQASDGSLTGFLTKLDLDGVVVWTELVGTNGESDSVSAVVTDSGGVILAGDTTSDLNGETNTGSWDAFVVKYDFDGNLLWTRLLGTSTEDHATGIAIDSAENIYISGYTNGVLGTDPSPGDPTVNNDMFVAKFASDGTLQGVTQLGTSCDEVATDVVAPLSEGIFTVGRIGVDCAFPDNSSAGNWDAILARLETNLDEDWVYQFGTTGSDSAEAIAFGDELYVTGYFDSLSEPSDPQAGNRILLAAHSLPGPNEQWEVEVPVVNSASGNLGRAIALGSIDPPDVGQIFVTGATRGTIDYYSDFNLGQADAFILNFDGGGDRH